MKKKVVLNKSKLIKIFLLFLFMSFPRIVAALEYPDIDSKVVEIYDLTDNKIIYEIDSKKQSAIASLTKIVTTITAIENIDNLDESVDITNEILSTVRWDASRAGLKVGDKVTYRDLLYASMIPSGSDATNSLAILSSGSIKNFVGKMNKLVSKVGAENTHFENVTGLDEEGHYSTADDIRKILEYALGNKTFKEIYMAHEYTLSNGLIVRSTINKYNNNGLINTTNILGSKTGFTKDAGYCLSSLSNINSHDFIIIVLNADHKENKYYNVVDTVSLIDFLLDNYKKEYLVKKGDLVKTIPVTLSNIDNYKVYASKNITKFSPSDYNNDKLKIKYKGPEKISFRNKIGEKIGKISYYYDDELISSESVIINTKIKLNIKKVVRKYFYLIIALFITLILVTVKKILSKKKKRRRKYDRK